MGMDNQVLIAEEGWWPEVEVEEGIEGINGNGKMRIMPKQIFISHLPIICSPHSFLITSLI